MPLRSAMFTFAPASTSACSVARWRAPAVAQHDRLDERRPAEIVDVVERRLGDDERAHHLVVAEVRRGDQRRAVVAAGDVGGLAADRERDLERLDVVGDGGDGDDVVAVVLERVRIGARLARARASRRACRANAATCSGVRPWPSRALTSAPPAASLRIAAASPVAAAANRPLYAATSAGVGGTCAACRRRQRQRGRAASAPRIMASASRAPAAWRPPCAASSSR